MRILFVLILFWCSDALPSSGVFGVLGEDSCGAVENPAPKMSLLFDQIFEEMKGCFCGAKSGLSSAFVEHAQVFMHPIDSVVAFFNFFGDFRENIADLRSDWAEIERAYPSLNQVQLRTVNCQFISHLALTGVPVVAIVKNSVKFALRQPRHQDSLGKDLAQDLPLDFFVETSIHGSSLGEGHTHQH